MPVWLIVMAVAVYVGVLFAVAWKGDRRAQRGEAGPSPVVYSLALAVYCTSWTFFGAVGTAVSSGWDYLPIYVGPALVFLFLPALIRRIGDVAQRESVTSLSDFISARYGKSRTLGAAVTLSAVAGSLPYIALQLKSVGMSFSALAGGRAEAGASPADGTVLLTALAMAVFAILFGARSPDSTGHNAGLMRALAFESLVKLLALLAVAALSVVLISGPDGARMAALSPSPFEQGGTGARVVTITFLSMAAILCLPRQFHVAIIERRDAREVDTARWLFPAYLAVTSLVVIPIAVAGSRLLPAGVPPDVYVLALPLSEGQDWLALGVFLGGFSAATGMIIVAAIALSTMVTNDLVVPLLMRGGRLSAFAGRSGERLMLIRRVVILVILLAAYGYYRASGSSEALAQIGLLSFAASVQFAPALVAAVLWKGGHRRGATAGIAAGMTLWAYTLFLPTLIGYDAMAASVPGFLDPRALFGLSLGDPLTHGVFWSFGVNIVLFIAVSLNAAERLRDRVQATAWTASAPERIAPSAVTSPGLSGVTPDGLKALAARFLKADAVELAFAAVAAETGVRASGNAPADWRLVQRTERLLASALGASSARVVMASAIRGSDVALGDVLAILDQKTLAERFDRHMLQATLESLPHGISVVDERQRLVAWNSLYAELFAYPPELLQVGRPVEDLIRHNVAQGWIDSDQPESVAQRRVERMKAGGAHVYERRNPDGRYLRIRGNPMPGGGYVSTFSDITADRQREEALIALAGTLEARVEARTRDLRAMAQARDEARKDAEAANASKTRFLAAASHDLLQPLNAARLLLGALARQGLEEAEKADLVARVDRAVQSADQVLKGLLDISRLEHGAPQPRPADLPLGPLLEDLADEARPMAQAAGLDIRVVPTRVSVVADPDFLQSILRNFLSNARRYTRKGAILIGARQRGDRVRIEVWDTGPGIAPERLTSVFEAFSRFEDTDNLGLRGTGLGLAVCARLAALMGAPIGATSRVGKGSVFHVSLPAGQGAGRAVSRTPAGVARSGMSSPYRVLAGMAVLCVDDEPVILEALRSLLSGWGCRVETARTLEAALEAGQRLRPDALLLDWQLEAGKTGRDVVAGLRAGASGCPPTALISASLEEEIAEFARREGLGFLTKPVDPEAVRAFLTQVGGAVRDQAAE